MINIISDDQFFLLGAMETLRLSGRPVRAIDIEQVNNLDTLSFGVDEMILISSENDVLINNTLLLAYACGIKVISVLDDASGLETNQSWAYGVISKKTRLPNFTKSIDAIVGNNIHWLAGFTLREMEVMNELLKGKSTQMISREMVISQKTVSAHKVNALKKMGLSRLNAHAITVYGLYKNILQQRIFG